MGFSPLRRGAARRPQPRTPPGTRIYAIGDIHGRSDLLARLHAMIAADAADADAADRVCVYIGDYVDRGADSRGVIDMLLAAPLAGFRAVHLKGNHEAFMLRMLDDPAVAPAWLANGGDATLASYGVAWREAYAAGDLARLSDALRRALPASHLAFLAGLALSHVEGDYLFVHAGVRPGVALEAQDEDDLVWIRDPFLNSTLDHGKVVVHGHTISEAPETRPNRIGIDTGAFATGRLTCLVLDGPRRKFLHT